MNRNKVICKCRKLTKGRRGGRGWEQGSRLVSPGKKKSDPGAGGMPAGHCKKKIKS